MYINIKHVIHLMKKLNGEWTSIVEGKLGKIMCCTYNIQLLLFV